MFGFGLKRQVEKLLERAYQKGFLSYKEEIRKLCRAGDRGEIGEKELECSVLQARGHYLDEVSETVLGVIDGADPEIGFRRKIALMSPELAGLPPLDDDFVYSAGVEYCITYYAFSGKPGKPADAVRQNHIFGAYVDRALQELQEEDG